MAELTNTNFNDVDFIFSLFDRSIEYQEKHGYPTWKNYDKKAIAKDVSERLQYKLVEGTQIAIVFSIRYSDPIIWRQMDDAKSLYLHRIVVNPAFKGQRLFQSILDWAKQHCIEKGLNKIRMDTWAENPKIIDYYKSFGFTTVEPYTTPDSPDLPEHNRQLALMLLEYNIV